MLGGMFGGGNRQQAIQQQPQGGGVQPASQALNNIRTMRTANLGGGGGAAAPRYNAF